MRTQIELPNEVAAELAGSQDAVLRALEGHLECKVFLRGNLLTLEGSEQETGTGERVVHELSELIARGHQVAARLSMIGEMDVCLVHHHDRVLGEYPDRHATTLRRALAERWRGGPARRSSRRARRRARRTTGARATEHGARR